MRTLIYSAHGFDKPFLEKAAHGKHDLIFTEQHLDETTANLAEGFDAIAIFASDKASAEVLEKLNQYGVKFIALRSVGYDHVDLKKAKELGILVANVPSYSPYAIAEHATALLLALNRKIALSQELIKQNDFRLDKLVGFDLHGKIVGIIGTGNIGAAFAKIMHGFGCKLIGFDVKINKELIGKTQIIYASLEELCNHADVISVHCPLNSETKQLFNKDVFAQMKKGALFINTARGGIVNTVDLLAALDQGIISGAGLDVYENEKPIYFLDHSDTKIKDELFERLRSNPKVLLTGHQAFLTKEALQGIAETTMANLSEWTEKGISANDLN